MTDFTQTLPPQKGKGKWVAGFMAAFVTTFIMSHLEYMYPDAMKTNGYPLDVIKGGIEGTLVSFFVWLTPANFVTWIKDCILFIHAALKEWKDAWSQP